MRALELGFKAGRDFRVYATESYPGMEGKQLAKELIAAGIPVTLIADSAVDSILQGVDLVLVGADSVCKDGSLIHKIGTREIATTATNHGISVHSSSESMKTSVQDFLGERPETSTLFDLTPAEFVSSYVTEHGEIAPPNVMQRVKGLQREIYP